MIILGLNAFHADAAAVLVRDGVLVAAAEEERFRRVKHYAGFPSHAIAYCLREAGLRLADVDHVAINQDPRARRLHKIGYLLAHPPHPGLVVERLRTRRKRQSIAELLVEAFPTDRFRGEVHPVEHHLAHLSSAFHVSPFEEAVVASIDGFGDFASAAWGVGRDTRIEVAERVLFPHSLGIFYQAITQYLGFPYYGDEYKVMGLAPYGAPSQLEQMRQIVGLQPGGGFELDLRYFRHQRDNLEAASDDGAPQYAPLFSPALEALLGPRRDPAESLDQRHRDIARSAQAAYEEAFLNMIGAAHRRFGLGDIALAGGCAANSVANGKIRRVTPYRRVYVQSAAGDAGGALGAAYTLWHQFGGARGFAMDHAYWGPQFHRDAIESLLSTAKGRLEDASCTIEALDDAELCRRTAAAIVAGKVIGWFRGRMEWGPRALGNRSILCDPRRGDIKAILNAKIKRRESFRPFAPSVLEEAVAEWFEEEDAVPFMMQVFQVCPEKRALVPAVVHIDGSARLQTVSRRTNPGFHRLIETFRDLTGVPMLLNTSFNENEPVVCTPGEALDCFLRSRMDLLVLGDTIVERAAGEP